MIGAASAVQTAAFTALSAGVTLAPVFQHVPQGQGFPVVIIESAKEAAADFTCKGDDDGLVTLTIRAIVEGEANKPALDIQDQVRTALANKTFSQDGWLLEFIFSDSDDNVAMPEDGTAGLAYVIDRIYTVNAFRA